jgi:hypothetical protein
MFENVSDTVYKIVYDSVAKYGLADEFVITLCNGLRKEGFSTEVECAIHDLEYNLFNGSEI